MRFARNYWVHQVFAGDYHVTFNKRGEVKNPDYEKRAAMFGFLYAKKQVSCFQTSRKTLYKCNTFM